MVLFGPVKVHGVVFLYCPELVRCFSENGADKLVFLALVVCRVNLVNGSLAVVSVLVLDEQDVVLVKEVEPTTDGRELEALAGAIVETLTTESYPKRVYVGISTIVESLKDLAKAYKEARIALEVGKVFDTERNVISYNNLGIGRLIYQLPTTLCEAFLQEVFKKGSLESLESRDDDTQMKTVRAFFENNLNVSKTAESLYVHRNTLVYRLEKIRKLTGLDLREFDHAVTLKVALMVRKYLASKPAKF